MNFGSHVDGVVAASAALVNAATPGQRQGQDLTLPPSSELARDIGAALRHGSRDQPDPPVRRVADFVALAAAVRPVFELVEAGDQDAAAATVNDLLTRFATVPHLEHHDGQPWHLHFHGRTEDERTGWGGGLAMGLATVLGSEYADRLGVCAAPSCDRVFVDVSRNGTRRFCTESCQNRVKAAAHRARQRAG